MDYVIKGGSAAGLLSIALLASVAAPVHAQKGDKSTLERRVSALETKLADTKDDEMPFDQYVSEFGGRIMLDQTFAAGSDGDIEQAFGDDDQLERGFEARRVRFYAEGALFPNLEYKLQLDFAGGVKAKSIYLEGVDLGPLPDIKVGIIKPPFSLQESTSSKYIALQSRSVLTDFFAVGQKSGIAISDSYFNKRLNYKAAIYQPSFDSGDFETDDGEGDKFGFSGRVTSPLYYANDGRRLIHAGFSYRYTEPNKNKVGTGLEPEVHKTNDFLQGTIEDVDHTEVYGADLAGVFGSLHAQAEYAHMDVSTDQGVDPGLDSYYIQSGFFLTGESRPYDKNDGEFGRVHPRDPVRGWGEGGGALEVVARYSHTDLGEAADAASFDAGGFSNGNGVAKLDVITAGLNWYPTAHSKFMLNYINADQHAFGQANYVTTRFQVDF